MRLIFDTETDGLLDTVSQIWCIGTVNIDTGEERLFPLGEIEKGIEYLNSAELLVAHNMRYDLEVFKKLYNIDWYHKTLDTLLMSQIEYPFLGKHSLSAWGKRFKFPKGDHSDWTKYTDKMGEYCLQDCRVTLRLWQKLEERGYEFFSDWNRIEHDFAKVQQKAVNHGVTLDQKLQYNTLAEINNRMEEIYNKVDDLLGYSYQNFDYKLKAKEVYKTRVIKGEKTKVLDYERTLEERWPHHAHNKLDEIKKEFPDYDLPVQYNKQKTILRIRKPVKITLDTKKTLIAKLQELGWKPEFYTSPSDTHPEGQPQLVRDGEVDPNLYKMGEEYKEFPEYFMLKHRKGLIEGFSKLVRLDGRVPADANTVGAVTGRVTHKGVANFPRVSTPYGEVIRAMFTASAGNIMIGSDLAGIEARMLAHFMNDPNYTEEVLNGDIHTANQIAAGLPTRDAAKTFFYGFLYGAGNEKVGKLVNGDAKDGQRIKEQFLENLPALKVLIEDKQDEASNGFITTIGGRPVRITKSVNFNGVVGYDTRKALNSLLQGSATLFFKKWAVEVDKRLPETSTIVILYHDECDLDCDPKDEQKVKSTLQEALEVTDKYFKVNCPNAIDTKVGFSWADVH